MALKMQDNNLKIEIVIPAYNEAEILENNVDKLIGFLKVNFNYYKNCKVIIADNGSIDNTWNIAKKLEKKYSEVRCLHLNQKGRGRALRKAWLESQADIVSYMDADLSADLAAFPKLIDLITTGGCDIAVGFRGLSNSRIKRTLLRKFLSCAYNFLIKSVFNLRQYPDAQCGFKAMRKKAIDEIIPKIKNQNWFFDSELLILAEKKGYKINYLPIKWEERLKSKVKICRAVFEDITGILRLLLKSEFKSET